MSDVFDPDPRHFVEYERRVDRENEQVEWELDDTRIMPKPPRRYRASKTEWIEFHEWRSEQRCWVCGARATNTHHILPRSQGGDDRLENFAPLCGSGTTGCHGLIEARDREARAKLRRALTPANIAYLDRKVGPWWLERHYPLVVAA